VRCEVDVVCVLGFNYLSAAGCAHCDIASTKVLLRWFEFEV